MNRHPTRLRVAVRLLLAVPGMPLLLSLLATVWCAFALSAAVAPDDTLSDRLEQQRTAQGEITRLRNTLTDLHTACLESTHNKSAVSPRQVAMLRGALQSGQAVAAALHVKWAAQAGTTAMASFPAGSPFQVQSIHTHTAAWFALALTDFVPALEHADARSWAAHVTVLNAAFARLQDQLQIAATAIDQQLELDDKAYQTASARALQVLAAGSVVILGSMIFFLVWTPRLRRRSPLAIERRVREAQARLSQTLMQGGNWRLDLRVHPHALHLSPQAALLFGLDATALDAAQCARAWQAGIHAAQDTPSQQALSAALHAVMEGKRSGYDQCYALRRLEDDQVVWLRDVTEALCDPRGQPLDLLGYSVDVTAHVMAQQQSARDQAIVAGLDQMKLDLIAGLGHDMRNPLNAIIGLSHLALQSAVNPRQADQLEKIQSAGHTLLQRINDGLDRAQLQADLLTLENREFALADVLTDLVTLFGVRAHKKGLELVMQVDPSLPTHYLGDAARLGQIVGKYIANALQHTHSGSVQLSVYAEHRDPQSVQLRFDVRDTGSGMSAAQSARAFTPPQANDRHGGGLALCAALAGLMGGAVGVQSTVGQGTHIWLTAAFELGALATPPDWPPPDLRGRRVLVADDHVHAQLVLADMLHAVQMLVDTVASGHATLAAITAAAAENQSYALLFLDWQMPDMDGLTVARKIAEMKLAAPPQIIMVTGYPRQEIEKAATAGGVLAVLSKPVTPSVLLAAVHRSLRGQPLPASPQDAKARLAHLQQAEPGNWRSRLAAIQGARILLVEDNEINQEVAFDFLTQAGFVVGIAAHGASALSRILAKDQHWNLVLMDLRMDTMDGFTATEKIREIFSAEALPIIALTASTQPEDQARCLAAGMQDFLRKPIVPEILWEMLLRWIPAPQVAAQSISPVPLSSP